MSWFSKTMSDYAVAENKRLTGELLSAQREPDLVLEDYARVCDQLAEIKLANLELKRLLIQAEYSYEDLLSKL